MDYLQQQPTYSLRDTTRPVMVVTARKTTLPFLRDWRQTAKHPQHWSHVTAEPPHPQSPCQAHHPRKSLPTGTIQTDSPLCSSVLSPLHTCKGLCCSYWTASSPPAQSLGGLVSISFHPSSLPRPHPHLSSKPLFILQTPGVTCSTVISVSCLY